MPPVAARQASSPSCRRRAPRSRVVESFPPAPSRLTTASSRRRRYRATRPRRARSGRAQTGSASPARARRGAGALVPSASTVATSGLGVGPEIDLHAAAGRRHGNRARGRPAEGCRSWRRGARRRLAQKRAGPWVRIRPHAGLVDCGRRHIAAVRDRDAERDRAARNHDASPATIAPPPTSHAHTVLQPSRIPRDVASVEQPARQSPDAGLTRPSCSRPHRAP